MAPRAHLAIYKVCGKNGCPISDILAGLDAVVGDGVDVLSISIGGKSQPFYANGMIICAFGVIQKYVFISCSTNNSRPNDSTLSNETPWVMTINASMTNRLIKIAMVFGMVSSLMESLSIRPFPSLLPPQFL